jgi:hypothetical protein
VRAGRQRRAQLARRHSSATDEEHAPFIQLEQHGEHRQVTFRTKEKARQASRACRALVWLRMRVD